MGQSLQNKNYYELFNLNKDASDIDIKRAHARLVRQYSNETHPEEFMYIQMAYQTLINPTKRNQYDNELYGDYVEEESYYEPTSYEQPYDEPQSYNHQRQTYDDEPYQQQTYDEPYQQQTYDEPYQQQAAATTHNEDDSGGSSLVGSIILAIILSFIFTPVVGIIAGLLVYFLDIKIPWSGMFGCLFLIIIGIIVLSFIAYIFS